MRKERHSSPSLFLKAGDFHNLSFFLSLCYEGELTWKLCCNRAKLERWIVGAEEKIKIMILQLHSKYIANGFCTHSVEANNKLIVSYQHQTLIMGYVRHTCPHTIYYHCSQGCFYCLLFIVFIVLQNMMQVGLYIY